FVQGDEDRVHGPFRCVVAFIQHRAPGVEQTHCNGWIVHLIAEVVRDSAIGINALKMRSYLAGEKPCRHMEVLVMRGSKMPAPRLRLIESRPLQRCEVLQRSA